MTKLNKNWKPKERKTYWFVMIDPTFDSEYLVYDCNWNNLSKDKKNYRNGNVFKTKSLAQKALKEILKLLEKAKKQ